MTPFERFADACGRGDLAAARQEVAGNPGLCENLSSDDRQAFLHIAQAGKAAGLGALLDCGFPVATAGPTGETALHWAAWHGWRDAVSVLLAHGAPVAAVEEGFGATPLGRGGLLVRLLCPSAPSLTLAVHTTWAVCRQRLFGLSSLPLRKF